MRRLRFIVTFPFPGTGRASGRSGKRSSRRRRQTDGLDYDRLARLNLTGGSIHNIALNAAFLAAGAATPVTMELVLEAARTEFRKEGRPINEAEFRVFEAVGGGA